MVRKVRLVPRPLLLEEEPSNDRVRVQQSHGAVRASPIQIQAAIFDRHIQSRVSTWES